MPHDPNQVKMGSTGSSDKHATDYAADPATLIAGTAVRLKSDGTLTTAKTDGELVGVSLGESLSKTKRLSVCKVGLDVPLRLTEGFVPVVGEPVYIDDVTGLANDGEDEEVDATITAAIYKSGPLDAVNLDGSIDVDAVAYIDMQGGL